MSESAFYVFSALTTLAAVGVVALPNPVHSAMSLVAALFLVAVGYASLGAHLVAALQIIIYAGAVMVLFLFVIMLLNLQTHPRELRAPAMVMFSALACATLAGLLAVVFVRSVPPGAAAGEVAPDFGTTSGLARVLFREHLVAFELTSILLLVAVVGAIVLARRERSVR